MIVLYYNNYIHTFMPVSASVQLSTKKNIKINNSEGMNECYGLKWKFWMKIRIEWMNGNV